MTQEEARDRAQRGAAMLDKALPGWFRNIDTGTLDLYQPCGCVIGQLLGDFNRDAEPFMAQQAARSYCEPEYLTAITTHGFHLSGYRMTDAKHRDEYRVLQDAWIEAIADRLVPTVDEGQPVGARFTPLVDGEAVGSATDRT